MVQKKKKERKRERERQREKEKEKEREKGSSVCLKPNEKENKIIIKEKYSTSSKENLLMKQQVHRGKGHIVISS